MADFAPSSVRITKAEMSAFNNDTRDILPLIVEINFAQSISMPSWQGSCKVLDTIGLLEHWPIRGEESLELELIGDDLNTKWNLDCQVYKIDDVEPNEAATGLFYTMHFISKISYEASKRKIIESYSKTKASDSAKRIFEKYYNQKLNPSTEDTTQAENETLNFDIKKYDVGNTSGRRKMYIQPSEGQLKVIIPNLSPQAAIDFLAIRSYSNQSPSCMFRFFETISNFYYMTDEALIKRATDNQYQIKRLSYGAVATRDPTQPISQVETIEKMVNPSRINLTTDLFEGGYKNRAIEIDLVRRNATYRNFDYTEKGGFIDMEGKIRKMRDDSHSEDFISDTFTNENAKRYITIRDFQQPGSISGGLRSEQYFTEIISNRMAHSHHMNRLAVTAALTGRIDIEPGQVVQVDAREMTSVRNQEDNDKLSGNYLVYATNHAIVTGNCNTELVLVKYD